MRTAYDLTHQELRDLVDGVQRIVFGRYTKTASGREIDFLDKNKEFSSFDALDSITISLEHFDLIPELGSKGRQWQSDTLFVCDDCAFAYEASALHPLRAEDTDEATAHEGEAAATGRCPRCDDLCRPLPAAALTCEDGEKPA